MSSEPTPGKVPHEHATRVHEVLEPALAHDATGIQHSEEAFEPTESYESPKRTPPAAEEDLEAFPSSSPVPPEHVDNHPVHSNVNQEIEADADFLNDRDEGYAASVNFSTASTSLSSSIYHYEYANGRRYNGFRSGAYPLPNDEEEQDRLDLLHHIFRLMLDGALFSAPIGPNPQRVLDIGTGTGIWTIDFADEFPSAEVIGTDISPIQPAWVPPNVKFYIDDVENEWIYKPHEDFDYIHCRGMGGSIRDWDKLCSQAFEHLKPGGWLEFQEPVAWMTSDDDSKDRCHSVNQWQTLCNEAARQFGKEIDQAHTFQQRMADAGFVDVEEKVVKVPIGPWPKDPQKKEIGRYQLLHVISGVETYTSGFIGKILGWDEMECKIMVAKTLQELRSKGSHMYVRFYFVCGRRPES